MESEANLGFSELSSPLTTNRASILRRVTKGFGGLSLNAAVNILSQVTIVPVALYAWGKIRYGEWIFLTGFVTVLRITDLGIQTVAANKLCASYARGDCKQMQRELHSALRIQLPMVLVVGLGSAALFSVIPIDRLFDLQTVSRSTFVLVGTLLVFELLVGILMGVVVSIYRATGRLARGSVLVGSQQGAIMIITLSLIAINSQFVILAAARLAITLVGAVWIVHDLRRLYPWLTLWGKEGSWRDGAQMLGPGLLFMLIPLADYVSTQFTLMVVQGSLDGGAVSRLATHRTLVNLAMMVSNLLMSAVWPEFTTLHVRHEDGKLIQAHRMVTRINIWVIGALAIGMLPFVAFIYPAWSAGRLTIDSWTMAFLVMRMLIWGTWSASMILLCSINRQKFVAFALIGAAALTGSLSLLLVPKLGVSGAALAQLVGDLCVSAWLIPLLAAREIKDSAKRFFSASIRAILIGILIPAALGFGAWNLIPPGVFRFVIVVPTIFILGGVFIWKELTPSERVMANEFFRGALRPLTATNGKL